MSFPYLNMFVPEGAVKSAFDDLRGYRLDLRKMRYDVINLKGRLALLYRKEQVVAFQDPNDYRRYNFLSDWFQEPVRMRARRNDSDLTPDELWKKNILSVEEHARRRYGVLECETVRESFYEMFYAPSTFRPTLMTGMIKHFGSTRVLDFSSGWGDRLIGAMAAGVERYCGVDPNPDLHPNYAKMIETLDPSHADRYRMVCAPFEKVDVKTLDGGYDLVMTSPPYYDLEVYTDKPGQSLEYGSWQKWYERFLLPSAEKAWSLLVPGGKMVIVINEGKEYHGYVERLVTEFRPDAYDGVISYAEPGSGRHALKSPQPMFVWSKPKDR